MKIDKSVVQIDLNTTTAFLIRGDGGNILIDTGYPDSVDRIISKIGGTGLEPKDISLIVITHRHVDHVGGLIEMIELTGAKVLMHEKTSELLNTERVTPIKTTCFLGWLFKTFFIPKKEREPMSIEPEILVDGEYDLNQFGVDGKIISTPGHTEGSISIILNSGGAIIGDLFFGGLVRKMNPGLPFFADSVDDVKRSIRKVLDLKPTVIYSSHGGPFDPAVVNKWLARIGG